MKRTFISVDVTKDGQKVEPLCLERANAELILSVMSLCRTGYELSIKFCEEEVTDSQVVPFPSAS